MKSSRTPRWLAPALFIACAVPLIAVALFLWSQGLDKADAWASVLSALAGISSLIAGLYAWLHRRVASSEAPPASPSGPVNVSGPTGAVIVGNGTRVKVKNKYRA